MRRSASAPVVAASSAPVETRAEYYSLIVNAINDAAAKAPPPNRALPPPPSFASSSFAADRYSRDGRWTVHAISDVHADMKDNMRWAKRLPRYPPRHALIVAGDVATAVDCIAATLRAFKEKFEEVFYVPGNHDLWSPAPPNDWSHAGHPANSIGKLRHIVDVCASLGVRVAPTILPGAAGGKSALEEETPEASQSSESEEEEDYFGKIGGSRRRTKEDTSAKSNTPPSNETVPAATTAASTDQSPNDVLILPMQSWYKSTFYGGDHPTDSFHGREDDETFSSREKHFDVGCCWPPAIGYANEPRNSHARGIADFFLRCNEGIGAAGTKRVVLDRVGVPPAVPESSIDVVSFSHFIPHPRLYRGHPRLSKVMGCEELGAQVRELRSVCHVFGHSHMDVDEVIGGCRYVQCALGYPNERWGGSVTPTKVWPRGRRRETSAWADVDSWSS